MFKAKVVLFIVIAIVVLSFVGSIDFASGDFGSLMSVDVDTSSMGNGDGPGSGVLSKRVDELNDLKIASLGENDAIGEYCYLMITHLTDLIYDGLKEEYGSETSVERSSDDTHKNAMAQDSWAWIYDDTMMQDVKDYLQYNLSCVLIGKTTLTAKPQEFSVAGNEYNSLKASGAFNRDTAGGLRALAKKFYHTGYFFYEVDKLADYILQNVIGQEVVQRDANKFLDNNQNGTFDYVEKYVLSGSDATYNIITDYESPYALERSEDAGQQYLRNGVWDRIQWGQASSAPVVASDTDRAGKDPKDIIIAGEVMGERAYTLDQIENIITAQCANAGYNAERTQQELAKYKQANDNTKFSGFKNYTNIVYYVLYKAMNNFTITVDSEEIVIPDVLTMTHVPNIVESVIPILDSSYNQEQERYLIPCEEYKSVLVTAKTLARPMNNFSITLYTNMNVDLQVDVKLRYHFRDDSYREDIGTYTGESHTVEGHIMTFNVPASPNYGQGEVNYAHGNINLTITPESLPQLQEKGINVTEEDITPMARLGVHNIILDEYQPLPPGPWWDVSEGYIAEPNLSHLGSSFTYQSELSDFLEIVFDVRGTYTEKVTFGFGFMWL